MGTNVRERLSLFGAVQGVGFRPFVFRVATELDLRGWVLNSAAGAVVELEGSSHAVVQFRRRLETEAPPACRILGCEVSRLDPAGYADFRIRESETGAEKSAAVLPDLATCTECRAEFSDPGERRFGYAFTNCTNCGPRFTILEDIPYDRPNTTMRWFPMCAACRAEYENPADRRFHAQPIACPACGPQLEGSIAEAAAVIAGGGILALKGVGGFQLLCDAQSEAAVARLRERKRREWKPFAVMFPDLVAVEAWCAVSAEERALLESSAAPIVLLRPRAGAGGPAAGVAAGSPYIGAMLPYSPLHHLLLRATAGPLVATSGNRRDEPIATDNAEARERLGGIADGFLAHDRPIARPCDDSVVRGATILRRARGYAPLPVLVREQLPPVLAVGAHLKNTVAIARGRQVYLSQHIGDLETPEAVAAFREAIEALCRLYEFTPEIVACDLHPDYVSTRHAESLGIPVIRVQHHMAHAAACAAENDVAAPYLGVAWDGTGLGLDGAIWGSEFFVAGTGGMERVAHLAPFALPGGDQAARDCRRPAFALLAQAALDRSAAGVAEAEAAVLLQMIERKLNTPLTTSMGRLFDGVALLTGVCRRNAFEGQAGMSLEAAIEPGGADPYPVAFAGDALDWRPVVAAVLADVRRGVSPGAIARRFHETAAAWIVAVARRAGLGSVVLSGGVFQNAYLTARAVQELEAAGFRAFTHQRVPPNDGGIALGQAVLAGQVRERG